MTVYEVGVAAIKALAHITINRHRVRSDFEDLSHKLEYHHGAVRSALHGTHTHAKKLFRKHKLSFHNLKHASTRAAAGAALAGTLFVSPAHSQVSSFKDASKVAQAQIPAPSPDKLIAGPDNPAPKKMNQDEFAKKVDEIMKMQGQSIPREGNLSDVQFSALKDLIKQQFDIEIADSTEKGFKMKHNFGYMGAEQHVPTHPGDTITNHVNKYDPTAIASGLTRGRAAAGYVPKDEEVWYTNGQTFLSDQFGTAATKGLFGTRFLVVQIPNDRNGYKSNVIKTGLWESGPGVRTKKVFGGSPEVIHQLGSKIAGGPRKDQVIYIPVRSDIPTSQLGPVEFGK